MLTTAKDLGKYSVRAADGALGGVDDLYLDDEGWTVRYVVVGAGGQISPRKALVTVRLVSEANAARRVLHTVVTMGSNSRTAPASRRAGPGPPNGKPTTTPTTGPSPTGPAGRARF